MINDIFDPSTIKKICVVTASDTSCFNIPPNVKGLRPARIFYAMEMVTPDDIMYSLNLSPEGRITAKSTAWQTSST